jgi:DNA polymerase III alpha subunit (gram-positive type)
LVPRTRNIALIGHDFTHDLHVLQILKFDLQTSIVGILDTQKIASELLPENSSTLSDILQALQWPFDKLHTAGNDAHFTLRALLLLAEKTCTNSVISTRNHNTLGIDTSNRTSPRIRTAVRPLK